MVAPPLAILSYLETEGPKPDEELSFFPQTKERDGILFSAFLGTNYHVYKSVYLFGEIGFGLTLATLGLSASF